MSRVGISDVVDSVCVCKRVREGGLEGTERERERESGTISSLYLHVSYSQVQPTER